MQYLAIIKLLRGLCAPSLEVIIPKGLRLLYRSETHAFFFYNIRSSAYFLLQIA